MNPHGCPAQSSFASWLSSVWLFSAFRLTFWGKCGVVGEQAKPTLGCGPPPPQHFADAHATIWAPCGHQGAVGTLPACTQLGWFPCQGAEVVGSDLELHAAQASASRRGNVARGLAATVAEALLRANPRSCSQCPAPGSSGQLLGLPAAESSGSQPEGAWSTGGRSHAAPGIAPAASQDARRQEAGAGAEVSA